MKENLVIKNMVFLFYLLRHLVYKHTSKYNDESVMIRATSVANVHCALSAVPTFEIEM